MDFNELLDPFERLLEDVAGPERIRQIESDAALGELWTALEESGFLDALVPEAAGGAGLTLGDVYPLFVALGRHAVPAPVAETMLARLLLAKEGVDYPRGPIVLAVAHGDATPPVPHGRVAEHVLVEAGGESLVLVPTEALTRIETGVHGCLSGSFSWEAPLSGLLCSVPEHGLRTLAALVRTCLIAGAAGRLLDMTVGYANERVQFGRRIGQQQAVQQQLAVMAQQVVAARLASEAACVAGLPVNSPLIVATSKQVCGTVAAEVANIAHAVHGAIGISEEYDLQLFTRRLHEWRLADGSSSWWALRLGEARLASSQSSVDFVRAALVPV
ncbi:MAG: acyl-CoA dehydrogenase family protein [Sphingobium sp.]